MYNFVMVLITIVTSSSHIVTEFPARERERERERKEKPRSGLIFLCLLSLA